MENEINKNEINKNESNKNICDENNLDKKTKSNMEQPNDMQVQVTNVKKEDGTQGIADGSIGKFKDTESLLNAYNSLQAEFTRKCQKLSELEKQSQIPDKDLSQVSKINGQENSNQKQYVELNDDLKETLIKDYLENLKKTTTPTVISDTTGSGIPLNAPPKPKSLEEAKSFVKNLFQ